jgi:regulator of cell morphogenesis and NO signaling
MTRAANNPNPTPAVPGTDPAAWETQEPARLIAFIIERFHEPLRRELPALIGSARLVEAKHAGVGQGPRGLANHLEQVALALESHLAKEERILFPLIVAGRGAMALMPIKVMMAEHQDHDASLLRLRVLTHDFALTDSADAEWRELYRRLQLFETDLKRHIALENDVLFPRAMGSEPTYP